MRTIDLVGTPVTSIALEGTAIPVEFYDDGTTPLDWYVSTFYDVGAIIAGEGANYYAIVSSIGVPPPTAAVWLNIGTNTAVRVNAAALVGVYVPSIEMDGTVAT